MAKGSKKWGSVSRNEQAEQTADSMEKKMYSSQYSPNASRPMQIIDDS